MKITPKQKYWLDHVEKARASGLNYSEYARRENLNLKALYNWNSLLSQKGLTGSTKKKCSTFVKITPSMETSSPPVNSNDRVSNINIELPNGVVVRCHELSKEAWQFLGAL